MSGESGRAASLGVGDDVERVVIDLDQVCGVARLVLVRRDDGGDRLADEDDFTRGEHGVFGDFQFGQRGGAGYVADLAFDVFAGVDGDHAGAFLAASMLIELILHGRKGCAVWRR